MGEKRTGPGANFVSVRQSNFADRGYTGAMEFQVNLTGRKDLSGEIYRQLRRAILSGRVRPGEALPPTRELARHLSVARSTVTVAYDRLLTEGFVTARVGSGTFVAEHAILSGRKASEHQSDGPLRPRPIWGSIPLASAFDRSAQFDFRTGLPDGSLFPYDRWRRLISKSLKIAPDDSRLYGEPGGYLPLREAIARYAGVARGVD